MVPVGDVDGHLQSRRGERQLRPVHQPGVLRPRGKLAERLVGIPEVRRLGVVVVVLHAGVARGLVDPGGSGRALRVVLGIGRARVGVQAPAVEQRLDPRHLVALRVVRVVARYQGQAHPRAAAVAGADRARVGELVHLADRVVDHVGHERLLWAPRRVEQRVGLVDDLHPRRRLLVGELEVRELAEVQQRAPARLAGRLGLDPQVLTQLDRFAWRRVQQ